VDITSKYGIGYKLSNNSYGVLFNDSSKVVLDPNHFHFDYIEKSDNGMEDVFHQYNFFDYPQRLNKKVILLQHFKSYLDGNSKFKPLKFDFDISNAPRRTSLPVENLNMTFLKKWKKAKKAILFRLSNRIIQVMFQD
jgi:polo-like kinase 1